MHDPEELRRPNAFDENAEPPLGETPGEEDTSFEALLRGFAPAAPRLNRDRLMFLAGKAAAEKEAMQPASSVVRAHGRGWLWPASTAAMTAVSLLLAVALAMRPTPTIVYREHPGTDASPIEFEKPKPSVDSAIADAAPLPDETPPEQAPVAAASLRELPRPHYLRQREIALTQGVEALPRQPRQSNRGAAAPLSQRQLLARLLPGAEPPLRDERSGRWFPWPFHSDTEDQL